MDYLEDEEGVHRNSPHYLRLKEGELAYFVKDGAISRLVRVIHQNSTGMVKVIDVKPPSTDVYSQAVSSSPTPPPPATISAAAAAKSDDDINTTSSGNNSNILHDFGEDSSMYYVLRHELRIGGKEMELIARVLEGDKVAVKDYVNQHGESILESCDEDGRTALYHAARHGMLDMVMFLHKDLGASLNVHTKGDSTILYIASQQNHSNVVSYAIENGAGVDFYTTQAEQIRILLNPLEWATSLFAAARQGNYDCFKILLLNGANTSSCAVDGISTFLAACRGGSKEIIKELIEKHEENPNQKTPSGMNGLILATIEGHTELVRYLVDEANIDINSRLSNGACAMVFAAERGNKEIMEVLIKKRTNSGVHYDERNYSGAIPGPLTIAAYMGHMDIVSLLLNSSRNSTSSPSATDDTQYQQRQQALFAMRHPRLGTPLEAAKKGGHAEIAALIQQRMNEVAKRMKSKSPADPKTF
eukprot:jgi/Bigna1/144465/aug1.87_g19173